MKPDIRITKKLIANRDYGGKNYNVLPVYDDGTQCLSCWKLSLKEGFKKYSEMRSDGGGSNWDDAVLVYESDECPEIDPNLCGCCSRCEFLCKEEGDDYIYIPDDDFTTGRG